jgi:hypothetical protein
MTINLDYNKLEMTVYYKYGSSEQKLKKKKHSCQEVRNGKTLARNKLESRNGNHFVRLKVLCMTLCLCLKTS